MLFVRGYGILGGLRSVGGGSVVAVLAGVRALMRGWAGSRHEGSCVHVQG